MSENYKIKEDRLNDYLYHNINNRVIRINVISNKYQDFRGYENQQSAMVGPWTIFFDRHDPTLSFDWGCDSSVEGSCEYSYYTPEEIKKIKDFITTNYLRLPGEKGYQSQYGGRLRYDLSNDEIVRMSRNILGQKRKFSFGGKQFTLKTLQSDLKKL